MPVLRYGSTATVLVASSSLQTADQPRQVDDQIEDAVPLSKFS